MTSRALRSFSRSEGMPAAVVVAAEVAWPSACAMAVVQPVPLANAKLKSAIQCRRFIRFDRCDAQKEIVAALRGQADLPNLAPGALKPAKPPLFQPTSTAPPFTLNTSPVMNPAYSVHKNSTGAAISSGRATRPRGIVFRIFAPVPGSVSAAFDISVSTQPGATQLT